MKAKEYLLQIRKVKFQIKALETRIQELEAMATHITPSINPDKVQTSATNRMEDALIAIVECQNKYADRLKKLLTLDAQIRETVDRLPAPYIQIVYYYYFDCMRFEEIAEKMNFSPEHIRRLHKIALDKVDRLLKK